MISKERLSWKLGVINCSPKDVYAFYKAFSKGEGWRVLRRGRVTHVLNINFKAYVEIWTEFPVVTVISPLSHPMSDVI